MRRRLSRNDESNSKTNASCACGVANRVASLTAAPTKSKCWLWRCASASASASSCGAGAAVFATVNARGFLKFIASAARLRATYDRPPSVSGGCPFRRRRSACTAAFTTCRNVFGLPAFRVVVDNATVCFAATLSIACAMTAWCSANIFAAPGARVCEPDCASEPCQAVVHRVATPKRRVQPSAAAACTWLSDRR